MSNIFPLNLSEKDTFLISLENCLPFIESSDYPLIENEENINCLIVNKSNNFSQTLSYSNIDMILDEEKTFYEKIHKLSCFHKGLSSEKISNQKEKIIPKVKKNEIFFIVRNSKKEKMDNSLFTFEEKYLKSDDKLEDDINFIGKRSPKKRPRKENKDNILIKIKRSFFNDVLLNKLNETLKGIGSKLFFVKFPQSFVKDISKKNNNNKNILNMTLFDIFVKKELYGNDLVNFYHNLKVVKSKDVIENKLMKNIQNKKYKQLFEEYLKSNSFQIDEINKLKEHNMKDDSIKRYVYAMNHFVEFFSK